MSPLSQHVPRWCPVDGDGSITALLLRAIQWSQGQQQNLNHPIVASSGRFSLQNLWFMVDSDRNWGRKAPPVDNTEKAAKRAKPGQARNRAPDQSNRTTQNELARALEHHAAGRLPQAESIYQQILQTDPRQPVAWHLLGVIAHQEGKNDVAVDLITKSLAIKPDFAEAHSDLGNALKDLGRPAEAVASFRRALALRPDPAETHCNLGTAFAELGKLDAAIASCRQALALKPDFAEAHLHLASMKKHTEHDDDIRAMEHAYAKSAFGDGQRMHLAFGLGKACEDLRRYDTAFGFFAEGNRNLRNSRSFSIDDHGQFFLKG